MRVGGLSPLNEQPHRAVMAKFVVACIFRRYGERQHRINPFSLGAQRLTAGDHEHVHRRTCPQQLLGHGSNGTDHVFAGIEHQQQ